MVSGDEGIDYSKQYLTIVSEEDNNVIYWLFVKSYGNFNSYKKLITLLKLTYKLTFILNFKDLWII